MSFLRPSSPSPSPTTTATGFKSLFTRSSSSPPAPASLPPSHTSGKDEQNLRDMLALIAVDGLLPTPHKGPKIKETGVREKEVLEGLVSRSTRTSPNNSQGSGGGGSKGQVEIVGSGKTVVMGRDKGKGKAVELPIPPTSTPALPVPPISTPALPAPPPPNPTTTTHPPLPPPQPLPQPTHHRRLSTTFQTLSNRLSTSSPHSHSQTSSGGSLASITGSSLARRVSSKDKEKGKGRDVVVGIPKLPSPTEVVDLASPPRPVGEEVVLISPVGGKKSSRSPSNSSTGRIRSRARSEGKMLDLPGPTSEKEKAKPHGRRLCTSRPRPPSSYGELTSPGAEKGGGGRSPYSFLGKMKTPPIISPRKESIPASQTTSSSTNDSSLPRSMSSPSHLSLGGETNSSSTSVGEEEKGPRGREPVLPFPSSASMGHLGVGGEKGKRRNRHSRSHSRPEMLLPTTNRPGKGRGELPPPSPSSAGGSSPGLVAPWDTEMSKWGGPSLLRNGRDPYPTTQSVKDTFFAPPTSYSRALLGADLSGTAGDGEEGKGAFGAVDAMGMLGVGEGGWAGQMRRRAGEGVGERVVRGERGGRVVEEVEGLMYLMGWEREVLEFETMLHESVYELMGKKHTHYPTDLPPPKKVLDIGTGLGLWPIAMSQVWPEASFIGLDLVPTQVDLGSLARSQSARDLRADVEGRGRGVDYRDVEKRVEWRLSDFLSTLPFDTGTIDFVHIRFCGNGIPEHMCGELIEEAARVLKRETGVLEVVETSYSLPNSAPIARRTTLSALMLANFIHPHPAIILRPALAMSGLSYKQVFERFYSRTPTTSPEPMDAEYILKQAATIWADSSLGKRPARLMRSKGLVGGVEAIAEKAREEFDEAVLGERLSGRTREQGAENESDDAVLVAFIARKR